MCDACGTSLLNYYHIIYKKYEISFINNVMTSLSLLLNHVYVSPS